MGRINYERTAAIPYQERQLKLDRMRQLLTRLGHPDAGMKIVHVAGTKGKGSTAAMIAGVLSAAGYRTGLFSSPHLERIEERFAVDGQPCSAAEFVTLVNRIRPIAHTMDEEAAAEGDTTGGPTYFEVTTAMALLHFVERSVDAAILEVGLGGRLDSTNVCLPAVCVITSISFDHTKQLGNTLSAIAREKAGVIKPGVPVICGVTDAVPQDVIAGIARDHGCRLILLGRDFSFEYRSGTSQCAVRGTLHSPVATRHSPGRALDFRYSISGEEHQLADIPLAMRGPHQAENAAVALATVAELRHQGWCVSEDAIRTGLATAALAGRVEVFPGEPGVVLDAAHHRASAQALIAALTEMPPATRRTLVLSVSHDKDVGAIVHELAPHFDRFIATQYQENPRAVPALQLSELIRREASQIPTDGIAICPTPADTWQHVLQTAQPDELVCITGSFYLAAEMRPLLLAHVQRAP